MFKKGDEVRIKHPDGTIIPSKFIFIRESEYDKGKSIIENINPGYRFSVSTTWLSLYKGKKLHSSGGNV